jgi:hypothetical protein
VPDRALALLRRLRSLRVALSARARRWFFSLSLTRRRQLIAGAAALPLVLIGTLIVSHERAVTLRTVNTLAEPLVLLVDGKQRAVLQPVSSETTEAGLALRLGPGWHRLTTLRLSGEEVENFEVHLPAATHHLYAPGSTEQCFWVEHVAYGQAEPRLPARRLLPREQRVWAIPDEIDAWFFPSPPASSVDHRSSGGTRTAIRQSRCGFDPWH